MRLDNQPRHYSMKTAVTALLVLLSIYTALDLIEMAVMFSTQQQPDIGRSVFMRMLALIPVVLMALMMAAPSTALRTKAPGAKNIALTLLLAFFSYLALSVVLNALTEAIVASGRTLPETAAADLIENQPFVLNLLLFCVFAPFTEELLFRGMLQNAFEKRFGFSAFVIAGALFGWMHGEPLSILNATIVGFLMGYIYLYTRSIWVPIIFHSFYNLMAFTVIPDLFVQRLPWVLGLFPEETMSFGHINYTLYNGGIFLIGVLMSFVLVMAIRWNNKKPLSEKSEVYISEPGVVPIFIISLVLLALRTLPGIFIYLLP